MATKIYKMKSDNSQIQERKITRDLAREMFLREVKKLAPFVLDDLEKKVLPLCFAFDKPLDVPQSFSGIGLPNSLSDIAKQYSFDFENLLKNSPIERYASINFQKALIDWACDYNLIDSWIFREALSTLEKWKRNGVADDWSYSLEPKKSYKNGFGLMNFSFEPYIPHLETWRSYRNRSENAFKNSLKNYRDEVESEKLDFQAYQTNKDTHFEWLIKHQICKMKYEDICAEYSEGKELARISEAIKPLARLIGLTLPNEIIQLRKK